MEYSFLIALKSTAKRELECNLPQFLGGEHMSIVFDGGTPRLAGSLKQKNKSYQRDVD